MKELLAKLAGFAGLILTGAVMAVIVVGLLFAFGAFITGGILYFANYILHAGFGLTMLPFYKDFLLGAAINLLRMVLFPSRSES